MVVNVKEKAFFVIGLWGEGGLFVEPPLPPFPSPCVDIHTIVIVYLERERERECVVRLLSTGVQNNLTKNSGKRTTNQCVHESVCVCVCVLVSCFSPFSVFWGATFLSPCTVWQRTLTSLFTPSSSRFFPSRRNRLCSYSFHHAITQLRTALRKVVCVVYVCVDT